MIAVRTCADCDAPITGRATRCPEHHAQAERAARRKRDAAYRKRKKAGQKALTRAAADDVTAVPATAAFLADYDLICEAVASLVAVPDITAFSTKAEAVQVIAKRAQNRQLEVDAAQARILCERRLGSVLIEMEEAGELRRHGQRARGSETEPLPPTLDDIGVDKKLSSQARALARLDGFEDRIRAWHGHELESGGRVSAKLLKTGAKPPRRENDAYYTPQSIVDVLCRRWKPPQKSSVMVWEPCCGDGRLAEALKAEGHQVSPSDIAEGVDFFQVKKLQRLKNQPADTATRICTNPAFATAREFIEHAFALGVEEMCLILPERFFASEVGRKQFELHRPAVWANLAWREDYLEKGGSADRSLAVGIWTSPCAKRCDYQIWGRGDG